MPATVPISLQSKPMCNSSDRAIRERLVNAAVHFVSLLPIDAVRRLAAVRVGRFDTASEIDARDLDNDDAIAAVIERWGGDLCGLLNAMTPGELATVVGRAGVAARGRAPELPAARWEAGAALRGDGEGHAA